MPPVNASLDQAESLIEDTYTYDALNRLSQVSEQSMNIAGGGSWVAQFAQGYSYDRYGNRTINAAQTWGTGINNKQFTVTESNNRLGVPSGQSGTMTYDAAGNLTTDTYSGAGVTRVYDADNRMVSETQAGGYVAGVYSYSADGQRVRRTVGGTTTWQVYGMDGELLAEYAAGGAASSPQKEYGYRNGALLVTAEPNAGNNAVQWLVGDQLGTPRMVADKTGSLAGIKRHDYLPFGEELLAGTGSRTLGSGYTGDNVRQKFTLYERDTETALDYAQARYYSPVSGRFTSADPLHESGEPLQPQSWNRYSYTINNPLKFVDPDGLRYVQRTVENGETKYGWCATDACYEAALKGGWSAVTFDETKPFEYMTVGGGGGERYSTYRLNPDGTHGHADVLDGNYRAMSTHWEAQFAIGGLLNGLRAFLGGLFARQAVSQAGAKTTSGLQALIGSIEKEIAESGAKTMGQRALAIERVLGKQGLEAVGKLTAEGVKITSKREITTIAKDGTVTITSRATGKVIKRIE